MTCALYKWTFSYRTQPTRSEAEYFVDINKNVLWHIPTCGLERHLYWIVDLLLLTADTFREYSATYDT